MDADEILKKVANEHSYETWGELMYDTHEHSQVEYTKEAMFIYGEQQVKKLQQSLVMGELPHIHKAGDGNDIDTCKLCGKDIRSH